MATSVLQPTVLNFKLDGGNTATSLTAAANELTFAGHGTTVQLKGLSAPSLGSDAVTKTYVDDIRTALEASVNGLSWKDTAVAGTTTALPVAVYTATALEASSNGSLPAQDGVTLSDTGDGDRFLVKNQTDSAQNGIYRVDSVGSASSKWKLIRTADADSNTELRSAAIFIEKGTVNGNKAYVQTADDINANLTSTALSFVNFGSNTLTGDSSTIEVSGNQISVLNSSITSTQLSANSVNTSKIIDANVTADKLAADSVLTAKIKDLNVTSAKIADLAVTTGKIGALQITKAKIASDVVGSGLTGGGGSAIGVSVDDSGIEINSGSLRLKDAGVLNAKIKDGAVDEAKLATSCAGSGLAGGAGTALSVNVDDTGIEINSDSLRLKDAGVTLAKMASNSVDENKLTTGVCGGGLTGGGGSAISIDIAASDANLEISSSKLKLTDSVTLTGACQATQFTASSDKRLKENIVPLDYVECFEKINQVQSYSYNFKTTPNEPRTGVIAQEIEEVLPHVVVTDKKGMKSVNYVDLIPYLMECIKQLRSEIDELKK